MPQSGQSGLGIQVKQPSGVIFGVNQPNAIAQSTGSPRRADKQPSEHHLPENLFVRVHLLEKSKQRHLLLVETCHWKQIKRQKIYKVEFRCAGA
jgi:hypothetical protein